MAQTNRIEQYLRNLPAVVRDYYNAILHNQKTESTIRTYLCRLDIFFNYLRKKGNVEYYLNIMPGDISEFLNSLECGNKNKALMWSVLNSFYEYLESEGKVYRNQVSRVERPKAESNNEGLDLTCSDLYEIYEEIKQSSKKWKVRDLALFTLLLCHGLKVGTIISINLDDYDNSSHKLTLDFGERLLFGHSRKAMEAWVAERTDKFSEIDEEAMFLSSVKQRITSEGFRKSVLGNLENTDYKGVKLEDARKVMAAGLLNIGIPISTIQAYLNHKDARGTYALLDEIQRKSKSIKEEDEEAILGIYGCGSVEDLDKFLNGIYLLSDTKHDYRDLGAYGAGTKIQQLPIDEKPDDNTFDDYWLDKDDLYEYCLSETQALNLSWVGFDPFESAGVKLSAIVFDQQFDYSRIENIEVFAARLDQQKYFKYRHISDESYIREDLYYYIFYAIGDINGDRVAALRLLCKDKALNQKLTAFGSALCSDYKAVQFHQIIADSHRQLEVVKSESTPMSRDKATKMRTFCEANISLFEFVKSFEGSEPLYNLLDEQIEKMSDINKMLSTYLLMDSLKELADIVDGFGTNDASAEDDEEDEDEDILEDYEPFGMRTPLLQNGDYSVYFEEVQVNDDDESANVCFEIYNHTNKSIHPWITRLTVDGNPAAKEYNNLGTVEIYDNEYLYLELNDISTDTYYDFSFVVDISDENNHSIVTTNTISMRIDFEDHTVKFDSIPTNLNYATDDEDEAEEDEEYCEFEDISFDIFNNISYQVQYMNPEVDGNDVSLSFYIRNDTDEEITVWAHNVHENGNPQEDSFMNLGTVAPNETEILSLSLNDIEDGDNGDVELSIEIDRDTSEKIFETDRVRIDIDFDEYESSIEVVSTSASILPQKKTSDSTNVVTITDEEIKPTIFPLSKIVRIRSMEAALGIDDLKLYSYIADGTLYIIGQVIAEQINNNFVLKCTIYDEDGDMIESFDNSSYGNALVTSSIKKNAFFNGYPFRFVKSIKKNTNISKIRIIPG